MMPDMTIREHMRERLRAEADPEYREFHSRLLPGITGIVGVRTPVLRTLAKELLKGDWKEYISQVSAAWKAGGSAYAKASKNGRMQRPILSDSYLPSTTGPYATFSAAP